MGNLGKLELRSASPFPGRLSGGTHYMRQGAGAPLLLIHDLSLGGAVWSTALIDRLRPDYEVVTFDLYGHGYSAKAAGVYFLESFLSQITRLLDDLGLARCTLVADGCSSVLALLYAAKAPQRVDGYLVTNCPWTRPIFDVDLPPSDIADALQRDAMLQAFNESCRDWFSPGFLEGHPEAARIVRGMLERCDLNVYRQAFRFFLPERLLDALAAGPLGTRGRFLVGSKDPCSDPAEAERLATAAGGEVELIDAYHLNSFEHAELLAERIRALHQG